MKKKHPMYLESLESRTLFAGAGDDVEFTETLEANAVDHNIAEIADDVACHTEELIIEDAHDASEHAEPADNEAKAKKKRSSRFDRSDFDWYYNKKADSKIPEPRFSHKAVKKAAGKSDPFWEYDSSKLTLSNVAAVTAEATWEATKIIGGLAADAAEVINNRIIGPASEGVDVSHGIRYVGGLATLYLSYLHLQGRVGLHQA